MNVVTPQHLSHKLESLRCNTKSSYPGTCIGLAVIVNNVETLMYVLIEFIFCLGIPKTPTREASEGMEPCYFHRRIYAFKQLKTL